MNKDLPTTTQPLNPNLLEQANTPAFPFVFDQPTKLGGAIQRTVVSGMTKREYFAALAMQALIERFATSTPLDRDDGFDLAFRARAYADALLEKLNEPTPTQTTSS